MTETTPARAAYEGFGTSGGGRMLSSSAPHPPWDELAPEDREAWRTAADAALMLASLRPSDVKHLERERDAAYRERARLVAFLAACYPAVMLTDDAEPDWPVVFVETPAGQLSWHIARADLGLFGHVPATSEPTWDGHTTEEKYQRLADMTDRIQRAGGIDRNGVLGRIIDSASRELRKAGRDD